MLLCLTVLALSCSRREVEGELSVSGRIEADEIDLGFKVAGKIDTVMVREGDTVVAGQVLARLSTPQEMIRLKEAQARLAGATARLNQARLGVATLEQRLSITRVQFDQATADSGPRVSESQSRLGAIQAELTRAKAEETMLRTDAQRYSSLALRGAVAQQIADQYESRVRIAAASVTSIEKQLAAAESAVRVTEATLKNPEIRAAEGRVAQSQLAEAQAAARVGETEVGVAQAAVERAQADLAELVITAPVNGMVITRAAEPGKVVAGGQTVLTLVASDGLYLRGFIPVAQSDRVKVGQSARIVLPSNVTLEGEVIRIDPQTMFTPENTYFREERIRQVVGIKARVKNNDGRAKVGMPADALIRVP